MLNSISRACIQQAVHAGSLYVTTTISVGVTERSKGLGNLSKKMSKVVLKFLVALHENS